MHAVLVEELGGPDVLRLRELLDPKAGDGQIVVNVDAAGVNFMDIGERANGPAHGITPFIPGVEGAGTVTGIGAGVGGFQVGDRVAWVYGPGSYAEKVALGATSVVHVPDGVELESAASMMMQGITAHYFTTVLAPLERGQVALVHAAAGGVGQLLTQFLCARGVSVIGLVSRNDKAAAARAAGADHVLVAQGSDFAEEVQGIAGARGVDAAFDSGGIETFRESGRLVRQGGTLVTYGGTVRVPDEVRQEVSGDIVVPTAVFAHHISSRDALLEHTGTLFTLLQEGVLHPLIAAKHSLRDARLAHADMEARRTVGKSLLIP